MSTYFLLKWMHILSSMLLVGTGFGSAFYLYFVNRTRNAQAIAKVSNLVVRADFWFTTPTIIIQPLTGAAMVSIAGFSFTQSWLVWTYGLYILAGGLLASGCLAATADGENGHGFGSQQ